MSNLADIRDDFIRAVAMEGTGVCNEDKRYIVPGGTGIGTEVETLALLYGMVLMLKPRLVIETGCDIGYGAQAIGAALRSNGEGSLVTCDVEEASVVATIARCNDLPVSVARCTGVTMLAGNPPADLYFLDSSYAGRVEELAYLRLYGKQGAVVLVHDIWLDTALAAAVGEFPHCVGLPGPRGLGVIRL